MDETGRYDVTNLGMYQTIIDSNGDVPDQVYVHGIDGHEDSVQIQELWNHRDEGRFVSVSQDTLQRLVENALTPATIKKID